MEGAGAVIGKEFAAASGREAELEVAVAVEVVVKGDAWVGTWEESRVQLDQSFVVATVLGWVEYSSVDLAVVIYWIWELSGWVREGLAL